MSSVDIRASVSIITVSYERYVSDKVHTDLGVKLVRCGGHV